MALTLISELKLKTEKGQDVTFYLPFLNDNRQLQFNFCSAFQGADYIVDEDKKAVEIRRRDKSTFIYFSKRDEQKFDQVMRVKQEILIDLRRLNQNFSTGKESLYAIESKDERYPFLITSPSIIDNGRFSIKYNKAIMYYINDKAKKEGEKH
ncbi:hypothetical protein PP175_27750 (plasmid) [Aneurinibacillus sp. Ricciae_BoGa-3]|uniref:hypothetical protein n=1 Tax=Aneurinibacillus sp. Ricciae_BoGa-3 TaxID=3022697 RepID=UPI0023427421|nr:hypothetical protein [Aneurinibacillus sp. Ricciae_BoGa-3]WCK56988.1 hypothetical protein PP175_27750 [Aneurinibacillus sp. Ricciae_BoGa-3]